MVVNMEARQSSHERAAEVGREHGRGTASELAEGGTNCLTIGLLNNMAGTAFKATERQFVTLLDAASGEIPIHVSFYSLPGMTLNESGGHHFASHYESVEALFDRRLDGLIVTGREPKMESLRDEPYWKGFTQVLEWARGNTCSTIWSCLAAHAAILHMDGIDRRKSDEKKFGVFECARESEHPLLQGLSRRRFHVPHSRWNGVAHRELTERGYNVLSRIVGDGIDTFIKEEESLFVFFQGHLEYETDTLMREFRRDVGRYIRGETQTYPLLPRGYFNESTERALTELSERATLSRNFEIVKSAAAAVEKTKIDNTWNDSARRIYRNWVDLIRERKTVGNRSDLPAFAASR